MRHRLAASAAVYVTVFLTNGCVTLPSEQSATTTPPTSAQAGGTTIVAIAPAQKETTLPQFLGLNALAKSFGALFRQGQYLLGSVFPGLEPVPALTAITNPANASSSTPSVAGAANIKSQEDQSRQKIKSLRYLATIGCGGCYPGVEKAFLSGLDDCTESVRLEAVRAIRQTAGSRCTYCNKKSCCSEKIRDKLWKMAYELDDHGCPVEPSARVRRFARITLKACGPESVVATETVPTEGPPPQPPAPGLPKEGPSGGESVPVPAADAQQQSYLQPIDSGAASPIAFGKHFERPRVEVCWERISALFNRFESPDAARAAIEQTRARLEGISDRGPDTETVRRLQSQRFGWTPVEAMTSSLARQAACENRLGRVTVYSDDGGVHMMRVLQRREISGAAAAARTNGPVRATAAEPYSAEPRGFVPR